MVLYLNFCEPAGDEETLSKHCPKLLTTTDSQALTDTPEYYTEYVCMYVCAAVLRRKTLMYYDLGKKTKTKEKTTTI